MPKRTFDPEAVRRMREAVASDPDPVASLYWMVGQHILWAAWTAFTVLVVASLAALLAIH